MAKEVKKNRKGKEIKEYPKLIKVAGKKIRVLSAEEEAKYTIDVDVDDKKKKPGWGK